MMKRCLSEGLKHEWKLARITEVQAKEVVHGEDLGVRGVPKPKGRKCLRGGFQVGSALGCCHHQVMGNSAVQKGADPCPSSFCLAT